MWSWFGETFGSRSSPSSSHLFIMFLIIWLGAAVSLTMTLMSDPVTSTSSRKKTKQNTKNGFGFQSQPFFFFFLEGKVYFGEVGGKSEEVGVRRLTHPSWPVTLLCCLSGVTMCCNAFTVKTAARDAARFPKNIFISSMLRSRVTQLECVCVCVCIQFVYVGVEGFVWFVVPFW